MLYKRNTLSVVREEINDRVQSVMARVADDNENKMKASSFNICIT